MQPHDFITLSKSARDITNQRFGRLFVLGPIDRDTKGKIVWLCLCDCGNYSFPVTGSLLKGRSKSCGCLHKDLLASIFTSHGLYRHPLYFTWKDILKRCCNSHSTHYKHYGGRGITVFSMWHNSLEKFIAYVSALPNYGLEGYSLDRIDNNGNYTPGNLRWATNKQQARNRTSNYLITYQGQTKCVIEWAEEFLIHQDTIRYRLNKGWSIHKALTTPVRKG